MGVFRELARARTVLRVPRSSQSQYGGLVFFLDFAHLAWAARRADSERCSLVSFWLVTCAPFRPILRRYSRTSFAFTDIFLSFRMTIMRGGRVNVWKYT
jgi:hypothetical protein